MKILITGGAGFIGSHIAELLHENHEVHILDNLFTGKRENLKDLKVFFHKADIQDFEKVNDLTKGMDYIFHLAALISVPESIKKPKETSDINIQGTINVLEAAKINNVKKVILSSSAAVYGDLPDLLKKESSRLKPKAPYAFSKLANEYFANLYNKEHNLKTCCLRYFNVYGPRQDPNSAYAAAIPTFAIKALTNKEISIYGNGKQTRDFIFVKDIARANIFAMENLEGVYNVASGKIIEINKLVEQIIRLSNSKSKICHTDSRPGDIKDSAADISKLKEKGFQNMTDFEQGLKETLAFYR
ncbi:NAD-dependent epimerase/dehydratase family protein [Candidatus Woesearchaeota archaeon]|nr:NAD-dependent epimerase/dehydratase family protein [Candidatus Woesearchaeota archaeon]